MNHSSLVVSKKYQKINIGSNQVALIEFDQANGNYLTTFERV